MSTLESEHLLAAGEQWNCKGHQGRRW